MHRPTWAIITATLMAISIGSAFAANPPERGFTVGAGIGQFNVEIDGIDGLDEAINDFDADDMSWKLYGGYRFNRYLAVEAAYVDFGKPSDQFELNGSSGNYSLALSGFAPYVVGTLPLGPVELSARLGYYFYDVKVNADLDDLGGDVFETKNSGEDVTYGIGVGMTFMDHLHTRIEYEVIDLKNTDDSQALWLAGEWRF